MPIALDGMCVCACARACACVVCHNEKKVLGEWQARQAVPVILQVVASTMQRKNTARTRGPFHQSITAVLTEEKIREAVYLTYTCCIPPVSGPRLRQEQTLRMTVGPRTSTESKEKEEEGK